jgi:DNA ligase (NAD+)
MYGITINNKGKNEKNKKVKEGECIIPFKYKRETHNECKDFEGKGKICATSVSKFGTLQTYGYCIPKKPEKISKNKTFKKLKKKIILKQKLKEEEMKRYNEEFIKIMGELYNIMISQGEPFRGRAYKKAQETIIMIKDDITNVEQLKGKPGIGETILQRLKEYVETGTLKILEREKLNPVNIFTQVYGIGSKKAKELVEKYKITSIEELRKREELLNDKQKIGLKYYEDILKRIDRKEIDEYKKVFEKTVKDLNISGSTIEIVGSYRRGAEDSGDIDVIIGNKNGNNEIFNKLIDKLVEEKIIIEILSRGKIKSLVMAKLHNKEPRRVDFLFSPPEEYAFAILYFTGSALFNTVMRQHALNIGYSMNEHGLYKMNEKCKTKGKKIDILFNNEKEIFDFLQLEYKEPNERKDGTSVVVIEKQPSLTQEKTLGLIDNISEEIKESKIQVLKKKKKLSLVEAKTLKKKQIKKITSEMHAKNFIKEGISYLYDKDEETLIKLLEDANESYYNENAFLLDNEYDILKEYIEKEYPLNKAVKAIGAPIKKNKEKLPYFMGSMDKIKPDTKALYKWMKKYSGPYVVSTKLDGISALYNTIDGVRKLYTRGDGEYGQDISYLIPYLKLPNIDNITIRGEIIMLKQIFDEKYKSQWSNARNLVSGIVNSKTRHLNKFKDLSFIAYELINPEKKPSEQFSLMETLNIDVAQNEKVEKLTNELLSQKLIALRGSHPYEIDGVIVTNDEIYERKKGNPEHAFAFKMVLSDQVVEAKVLDVLWAPSKDGYLKPRIRIEPVKIGGANIEYATAFNGAFVRENKIGVGAVVQMVRSGDVIPHIMAVITEASEAKMPDVDYKWNETNVDIMLVDKTSNEIVIQKNITGFFTGLGVDSLGSGNVKKIIKSGKDSVDKILKMTMADFMLVQGFKEKMASKIYESIDKKIKEASLTKLMIVSNLFGRGMGERRIELVLKEYPDILTSKITDNEKINNISSITGLAKKTAELFVRNIPEFMRFIKSSGLEYKLNNEIKEVILDANNPLFGKSIVMTGFRDKELERKIISFGGKIASSVNKKIFMVIAKRHDEDTGKALKAKEIGIPLITIEEFTDKYL